MTYSVTARNYSQSSSNKIHSDDIAQRYGFTGALVPGVAVYGHLVHPIVERHGASWLGHSVSAVRLLKPAYDGDALQVELETLAAEAVQPLHGWQVTAPAERSVVMASGATLATLQTQMPKMLPPPWEPAAPPLPPKPAGQPLMTWDTVIPNQPLAPWTWTADATGNARYATEVDDQQPLYEQYVHPHWLLSTANEALVREYDMPAWIHAGSEICMRSAIAVNDTLTIEPTVIDKWERKGHQFIRLYLAYRRGTELTTEILHTAIFRIAT